MTDQFCEEKQITVSTFLEVTKTAAQNMSRLCIHSAGYLGVLHWLDFGLSSDSLERRKAYMYCARRTKTLMNLFRGFLENDCACNEIEHIIFVGTHCPSNTKWNFKWTVRFDFDCHHRKAEIVEFFFLENSELDFDNFSGAFSSLCEWMYACVCLWKLTCRGWSDAG